MKGKRIPEIRFSGFTDDWKERKLGEVFEQTSEYVNPKVENLELWSLTVENGLTPKTERYNREFLVKKEDQFKAVSDNEFIYNPMNMTLGAVDLNLTGKKVAVSGYYITMKTTDNYDSKYFGIWLKTPLAIRMYKLFATGSLIERQRVQFPTLSQIKTMVPSKDEQVKIGTSLKQLDDLIELHQLELITLKQTKQGFLQKMFPKEGESVPEIRFPGFTGDWEQRKLKAVVDLIKDGTHGTHKDGKDAFLLSAKNIKNGQIIIDELTDRKISTDDYNSIFKNYSLMDQDLLITIVGTIGQTALYTETTSKLAFQRSVAIIRGNKDMNQNFLKSTVDSSYVQKQLKQSASMSAQAGVYLGDLEKLEMNIPKLSEQIKIGNFFKQLEDTIALYQRELEALEETKKAFLQKMFI